MKKKQCQCGYCYPEGKALYVCDKASEGSLTQKEKPYLVKLLSILFLPRSISNELHFTIEGIPIGWIIVGLSVIVNILLKVLV